MDLVTASRWTRGAAPMTSPPAAAFLASDDAAYRDRRSRSRSTAESRWAGSRPTAVRTAAAGAVDDERELARTMAPLIGITTYSEVVRHGRWEDPSRSSRGPTRRARRGRRPSRSPSVRRSGHGDRGSGGAGASRRHSCYRAARRLRAAYGRTRARTSTRPSVTILGADEFEAAASRVAWKLNIPTLAICRGLQILNVALGGTLIADLESAGRRPSTELLRGDFHAPRHPRRRNARPRDSATRTVVPSHHHQATPRSHRSGSAAARTTGSSRRPSRPTPTVRPRRPMAPRGRVRSALFRALVEHAGPRR